MNEATGHMPTIVSARLVPIVIFDLKSRLREGKVGASLKMVAQTTIK